MALTKAASDRNDFRPDQNSKRRFAMMVASTHEAA
jgi:hypothetical protein